jgi:hypothetical protein
MKKVSEEHFEEMKIMSEYFNENSRNSKYFQLYEPEADASKLINTIIENETDSKIGIEKINYIINEIEQKQHLNDVHWFDFMIHVNAVININK